MDVLPVLKRPGQRWQDVFSEQEIDDLYSLPLADGVLMRLLVEAGLRKAEARKLQLRRLKLEPPPAQVVVVAGKGGKDRVIVMSSVLRGAVEELLFMERLDPLAYLWYSKPGGGRANRSRPIGDGSFDRWWRRCVDAAGVRYRNPHVTRHTFATRWLRRGGRLETLSGQRQRVDQDDI